MSSQPNDPKQSRTLLRDFVMRDLKARYVGSSMGFFWSVIFPIVNLIVFTFVFRVILKTRWGDEQGALEVALVMLAGIVVWTAFSESLTRATNCVVDNANLIQKVVFPAQILPSYITWSAVLNMCIGLPIVIGSALYFGYVSEPTAAIERQHQYIEVYEGFDPEYVNEDGIKAPPPPRVFVSLERSWRNETTFTLEYGGTATRGVDYLAPHDTVTIPAGRARLYVPVIPVRDAVIEGPETIIVRATDAGGRALTQSEVLINLVDNELPPEEIARDMGMSTDVYTSVSSGDHYPLALGPSLLALPLLIFLLVGFTVGLGSFLATFNLFWRDTFHLVGVGVTVWMFATPIFYPAHMVAETSFSWLLVINPMHWFIEMFREVTLFGRWPTVSFLIPFAAVALVAFLGGRAFFRSQQPNFPDLL